MANILWLNETLPPEVLDAWMFLVPYLAVAWEVFITWWWLLLPFILFPVFLFYWRFWRMLLWDAKKNPKILLEIRIPGEILKPMRAMETVLSGFWQIYGPGNWFEKWWEGQDDLSFSLEIVSIEGVPHFLMRIPEKTRDVFESHIYAQYPDAEIEEVEDYTKNVPQNIPNENWDLWGTDYTMPKKPCYPLKTYLDFETEREAMEEKRIDPIAALMEGLSKLGPGEQIWIQISATPLTDEETGFITEAKREYEKLAGRKAPLPPKSLLKETVDTFIYGPGKGVEGGKEEAYPEMKLTPGEKEIVRSIERKIAKQFFKVFMRYVYVAHRSKFSGRRFKIPMSYFNEFNTNNMGMILPWGKTLTKVKRNWYDWFWFSKKRLYPKKRAMFRNYVRRLPALFPLPPKEATFILNTEELTTMYHFPSRITAPPSVIPRVESKKREAPYDLPVEE